MYTKRIPWSYAAQFVIQDSVTNLVLSQFMHYLRSINLVVLSKAINIWYMWMGGSNAQEIVRHIVGSMYVTCIHWLH